MGKKKVEKENWEREMKETYEERREDNLNRPYLHKHFLNT